MTVMSLFCGYAVAGPVPIKSCEDAAVKYNAENGQRILLLGGGNVSKYYYFQNFLVAQHARRGKSNVLLIGIGSFAALVKLGPGAVDNFQGGPLPICAVGKFAGYETLDNGTRVAAFNGVYLGR